MVGWLDDWLDTIEDWFPYSIGHNPNYKKAKVFYKMSEHQIDYVNSALDDPEKYDKIYDDPIAGTIGRPLLDWYKDKKIKEDAQRYYDDLYKNTGETYRNSPYKWKDYYEKGAGRYSGYGSTSELFEASTSVINQFNRKLLKW